MSRKEPADRVTEKVREEGSGASSFVDRLFSTAATEAVTITLRTNLHTLQVDVFSFGIVLWEVWTLGEQPYPNLSLQEIFAGVMTGTLRPAIPTGCDPAWSSLMQVSQS